MSKASGWEMVDDFSAEAIRRAVRVIAYPVGVGHQAQVFWPCGMALIETADTGSHEPGGPMVWPSLEALNRDIQSIRGPMAPPYRFEVMTRSTPPRDVSRVK